MKRTNNARTLIGWISLSLLSISTASTVFAKEFKKTDSKQFETPQATEQSRNISARIPHKADFEYESSDLIANVLYKRLSSYYKSMAASGANGANVLWENKQSQNWYIEQQRYGEQLVIGGIIRNDPKAIRAGFKMFDWGFAHQAADGSFPGTSDPFHSTSFFVQAVAHTLLFIQQSPYAKDYAKEVQRYTPLVHRAALWMTSPKVWDRGSNNNQPYTHRRYLVAAALGLTGKLTGDRQLLNYAQASISDGLSLQKPDGVNPEKGSFDSSYQMVGVVYAQRWLTYFPNDELAPKVNGMINKALLWQKKRILPSGKINSEGNSRTAGQERGRTNKVKDVDYSATLRGFAYWSSITGNQQWNAIARRIAQYYTH
ncbi:hypothetical protein G7B40_006255 [Aetokthonos hydrillicola Thurmond2011]|jgi:hypothetical protein|uniref:Uncharacterized protein n=1 Tax=Aetokthonos hydrillicola Thurmond2011 TaxID=2712845 RepID=A0AAP5I5I2_9CYAN|nr:hypothetical protein [Aetokthonos hydrillicola]MBO3463995.1 hypothetical protein [Aetokthonos hydrillicola CCALA 1050]MBW4585067.1 hypothetical protein [Aetokthonos hydrillicola CCALA 1050]MDR9894174.1 hypothetical protein [Aetokthonos hydrillicola Thurmond2011]